MPLTTTSNDFEPVRAIPPVLLESAGSTQPQRRGQTVSKEARVEIANRFLEIIASHGRKFFAHERHISRFELDKRRRVWFVDKYSQKREYTHYRYWGRRFTEGGTMFALAKHLQAFIMGRESLPISSLGPWPDWYCDGDLWGYGDDMAKVRAECAALATTEENTDG